MNNVDRKERFEVLIGDKISPVETQLEFIEKLSQDFNEYEEFKKDPKTYCLENGVNFDPVVIRMITNSILFDNQITDDTKENLINEKVIDIRKMTQPFTTQGGVKAEEIKHPLKVIIDLLKKL